MKIGILTFHWATNYGAILQCYALQTFLSGLGHEVDVINYKPGMEDDNLVNFIFQKKFKRLEAYSRTRAKERKLVGFRKRYLNLTRRYRSEASLREIASQYDVVISGSDQVMNNYFLVHGEKGGSEAYFLSFDGACTRLAYASSFSTTHYPDSLAAQVSRLVARFNAVSAREDSGVSVFAQMGREDALVVPDPVLLLGREAYERLLPPEKAMPSPYTFVYMLRNKQDFVGRLKGLLGEGMHLSEEECIEDWLAAIRGAASMVTNSFHGVVFCLIFHVPFVVVLEQKENVGMNDRFYTLLSRCHLTERITTEADFSLPLLEQKIDWLLVDKELEAFVAVGCNFLEKNIV